MVRKGMPMCLARYKAQQIIKKKTKTKVFESETHWTFRNAPRKYFRDVREQKINDDITLVVGPLNDTALGETDMESTKRD